MTIHRRTLLTSSLALAVAGPLAPPARAQAASHLLAYDSEAQLREALERWQQRSQRLRQDGVRRRAESAAGARQRGAEQPEHGRCQEHGRAGSGAAGGGRGGRRRVDHQRADGRRRRGRHRQARRRLPDRAAARPPVHGARRRRRLAADRRRRRLRAGREPARRLVRRAAGVGPRRGGDRLLVCARRHRDRPVRARRRRRPALPRDASPALVRLLQLAQLREPADRPQAGVLHADLAVAVGSRSRGSSFRPRGAGRARPTRWASSASCRPRACTAPTTSSSRASRWRCTPSPRANSAATICAANPPPCSARRAACSTCRRARSTCGPAAGAASRWCPASASSRRARCRPCSACRSTAPRRARSRPPACRSTRCRFSRRAAT